MPNPPNKVEIMLDEEQRKFSLKINDAEINRVKGFALKCEAGGPAELTLRIDTDTLKLG